MYITNNNYCYYRGSNQHSSKKPFLILMQDKNVSIGPDNFRAVVRKVALQQLGPWMMGIARIKNQSIIISGAYGGDGLPINVSKKIFKMGIPLPKELYSLWNKGGGWNSCGSEASAIKKWAIKTFLKT